MTILMHTYQIIVTNINLKNTWNSHSLHKLYLKIILTLVTITIIKIAPNYFMKIILQIIKTINFNKIMHSILILK